jgi:hypothetical protein
LFGGPSQDRTGTEHLSSADEGSSSKTATTVMKLGSISTESDFFVEVFASFFIRFGLFAGVTECYS